MFSWLLPDKPQQTPFKFIPKISVNTKSSLAIEVEPKDPTTTSNIIITAFVSSQNRTILPIRIEWSRFKIKSQAMHSVEKINGLIGNTYMCEPSDVGGYIKAVVRTTDDYNRQEAQITIGPIGIEVMVKRVIDGALYSGNLLSQVTIWEKDKKSNVTVRLFNRRIQFIDDNTQEKLSKDYTLSEPKIELNPKDPTRVYLRFQQDQINEVRDWLNRVYQLDDDMMDESSLSVRVPYSNTGSSKARLFQKAHNPCVNKIQMRFISRLSRDLFLFTQRVFMCKQDMKNSVYLQKIQTLQNLSTEQDYHKFMEYVSLKLQICRLADYAKEVEQDRNSKVKDLVSMQQSIGQMTLTYLKIIEEKGRHEKIDFEASYSQINNTREQIMNRKNLRELKSENEKLKIRLREMNEEIQLLKFFKKQDNQSMIFNQTSNPFAKKQNESMLNPNSPPDNRKNMYEMSINYAHLLEENKELKREMKRHEEGNFTKGNRVHLDRSHNMMDILGSLQQKEEQQMKFNEYQNTIRNLKKQIDGYRKSLQQTHQELSHKKAQLHDFSNRKVQGTPMIRIMNRSSHQEPSFIHNQSLINQSINSAYSDSFNHTITSEVALAKLEENLYSLQQINNKLQEDSTRLRRERDYFKVQFNKLQTYLKEMSEHNQHLNQNVYNHQASNMLDDSMINRYKQQNQTLQNERNSLIRKIQSLSRQNGAGLKEQLLLRQRRIKQLEYRTQQLQKDNKNLSKQSNTKLDIQSLQVLKNENAKIKKINSQLLQQIKSLKIQLQNRIGDNMYNSRVIQLENQLGLVKNNINNQLDYQKRRFLDQINELTKLNAKLKKENQDKQLKLNTQALTIEKLMLEHSPKHHSTPTKDPPSLNSTNSKEKSYSQKFNQSTMQQVQKYKREVKRLQEQIIFMKKSSDAINRSRDLTMEMDGYYQEKLEIMKREMEALYVQNENLSKMCEKYGKDAREASKQVTKWRQKAMNLMKAKNEESLLLN